MRIEKIGFVNFVCCCAEQPVAVARDSARGVTVLFEFVKDGRVKNPLLVLEPQARRVSQMFDEEQDFIFTNAEGEEIDEDEESADDEEIEAAPAEDPYLERRAGGQRVKQIPDITKFLDQPAPDAS